MRETTSVNLPFRSKKERGMDKILFCSFRNNPYGIGGGITTIIEMFNLLKDTYEIDIMTPFHIRPIKSKQHIFLKKEKNWNDLKLPIYLIKSLFLLFKIHKKYKKILVFLPNPSLSFIGDIYKIICQDKLVIYFEGIMREGKPKIFHEKTSLNNKMKLMLNNKILGRLSTKKNVYIVSSNYQKNQLINIKYKSSSIWVIPNLPKSRKYYENELKLKKNKLIITYLGHLNHEKGVDLLIDSYKKVQKSVKNTLLCIVSNTSQNNVTTKKIVKKCKHNTNINLYFERVNVHKLFKKSKIAIFPYRSLVGTAIYPSSILEAMKNRVLVISRYSPILTEILPVETLFLDDDNEIQNLSSLIIDNLTNDSMYTKNLNKQKSNFNYVFNRDKIKSKLKEVLQ